MRSHNVPNARDYHQPIANNATDPAIDPKRRYLCRHVFTDGHRCGSPSLRGKDLCYYHVRSRRDAPCATRGGTFVMSRIEDRPSVQLAIYDVLSRVAAGDIEYRRGSVLLYGLQIASSNLARQEKLIADQPPQVEEVTSDYDLGDLAPIVEITEDTNAASDTATAPDTSVESDVSTATNTAAAPNATATQEEAVILNAAPNLAAVDTAVASDAVATIQLGRQLEPRTPPRTSNLKPRTLPEPRTAPPLPTHDATGRPYPPPHKLDPPSNGMVPRLRSWRTQTTSSPNPALSQPATDNPQLTTCN